MSSSFASPISIRLYNIAIVGLGLLLIWEFQDLVKFHSTHLLPDGPSSDFSVYYYAAQRVLNNSASLYEFGATLNLAGYTYPPLGVLLFAPFTLFDYHTAYILFQFGSAIALMGAIWCALDVRNRIFPQLPIDYSRSTFFALLILASGPAFTTSVSGQVNSIVLVLCVGGILMGMRGKPIVGGIMLAFACWIKIYPVLLVVAMLSIKSLRLTAFVSVMACVLLPVAMIPLVPLVLYEQYFLQLLPVMAGKVTSNLSNQSITATIIRFSVPVNQWSEWINVDVPGWIRALNGTVLVGVMAMFSFTRISKFPDFLLVTLLSLAFIPLIAPLGWGHSYLFSMPLVAYCIVYCEQMAIRVVAAVAWFLLLVPAYSILSPLREFATPVVEVLYFRYFIAVWAVILFALAWVYNPKSLPIEGRSKY